MHQLLSFTLSMRIEPYISQEQRDELARMLKALRADGHRRGYVTRGTEPKPLAEIRQSSGLGQLVRATVAGWRNRQNNGSPVFTAAAMAADSLQIQAESPFRPDCQGIADVVAAAEHDGLDFDTVDVHEEERRIPYDDYTDQWLVATQYGPIGDSSFFNDTRQVYDQLLASRCASAEEEAAFRTYLELRKRFEGRS